MMKKLDKANDDSKIKYIYMKNFFKIIFLGPNIHTSRKRTSGCTKYGSFMKIRANSFAKKNYETSIKIH